MKFWKHCFEINSVEVHYKGIIIYIKVFYWNICFLLLYFFYTRMHTYIEAFVTGIRRKVVFLMSVLLYNENAELVKRIHKLYILDIPSNVWLQYSVKYFQALFTGCWDYVSEKRVQINSIEIISKTAFYMKDKGVFHLYYRRLISK